MNWLGVMMVMGDAGWGIVRTQAGTVYATDVSRNVVWNGGGAEEGVAWWILESIPMKEFEGIPARKEAYLQVRRVEERTGVGKVVLRISRGEPRVERHPREYPVLLEVKQGFAMNIEITKPEIEAMIQQRLQKSGFDDPQDVILQALRESEQGPGRDALLESLAKSLEEMAEQAPQWLKDSWANARESGLDLLTMEEIDAEIEAARKARRATRP